MNQFAPIVLFVYNRPIHTESTLTALSKNLWADQSDLFVFCDGVKKDSTIEEIQKNKDVKKIITSRKWCKNVYLIERDSNLGLSKNITYGISEILKKYDKCIVLEDDIVPEIGFLEYMNNGLNLYSNDLNVGCIHAWNYEISFPFTLNNTFFLKGGDCWGWGTWSNRWVLFNGDAKVLLNKIISNNLEYSFNRNNTHPYIELLQKQIDGVVDSWAICWHASLFINEKYCLQPARSIVKNIGFDGSGVHCSKEYLKQKPLKFIKIKKIKVKESTNFFLAYKIQYTNYIDFLINLFKRLFKNINLIL